MSAPQLETLSARRMQNPLKPLMVVLAVLLIAVGLVMWPLPIPLGIPMIATGCLILLRYTWTGRRFFVRMLKRFPQTVGPIRAWLRRNRTRGGSGDAGTGTPL